jgi:glutamate-5-semialdehyde dehydrogenase
MENATTTLKNKSSLYNRMTALGEAARAAALALASASTEAKNLALKEAATALRLHRKNILEANRKDVASAKKEGITRAFLDRLELDEKRILQMAKGLEEIAELPDPVGRTQSRWNRPNGLVIERVSVPLGVIGIIYESRPNVTADAAGLCLKSGNACILRGGSESFHSSSAILACLHEGLKKAGIPESAIQLVPTTDREAVGIMLKMASYIDIIIPRGGKGLIQRVIEESRIPLLQHLDGNCHTYLHAKADPEIASDIVVNAKMRRTGICGATESLLVDEAAAADLLPGILKALKDEGCEIRGDETVRTLAKGITAATEEDWDKEYLDAVISVKTVRGPREAIDWINRHGSHHTDAIITQDEKIARQFLKEVDSAIVMHNTSTQFADGGEFGMGAEIGIATGRLHARGPVGVEQLTTYKYVVHGQGQVRPK